MFSIFYFSIGKKVIEQRNGKQSELVKFKSFSITLLIYDLALLTIVFYLMNYFKRDTFQLSDEYENLLFVIFALWLVISIFTRKFEKKDYKNIYYAITPHLKTIILMGAIMSVLVFGLRMFYYSRLQIFGALALFLTFEIIYQYLYYIFGNKKKHDTGDIENHQEVRNILQQEDLTFDIKRIKDEDIVPARFKLKENYLRAHPKLFDFIYKNLNLNKIDISQVSVLNTHTFFNIEIIDNHSISLFINLHRINDFRWLNRYFLEVHKKIYNGGYFVGCVETINTHRDKYYKKYSSFLAQILYPINFFLVRIIPKLPGIKKIYFIFTKGKNRVVSKAEVLGRLYFCGFKVITTEVIDDCLYFITQRVKTPSLDRNPSYGPLIKLRRIGLNKEILQINKFRTMHPYSEYLQEYIFDQNKLNPNGKFQEDFRVTAWGRIFRKMWVDELPQIVNFLRGDLSLVGVRALSEHYFNLYPKSLQDLRTRVKPGLVPPYYADMPKSLEEIVASEKKYLEQKRIHPFTTDVKYLSRSVFNIIFRKARSQ